MDGSMNEQDLLKEIKERFKTASDAVDDDYTEALEDLRFKKGEQWPPDLQSDRESDGRPCLIINKIPTFCDQVAGDIRQNEPAIKVKPVDSKADPKTAEIFTGLIRNIEVQSDAETAYDTAVESAIDCGFGAWRIGTKYTDDDVFEQDIVIQRIKNPFTVLWAPMSQNFDRSDAQFCFVTEKLSRDEFKRQYPKAGLTSFEGKNDENAYWGDEKNIRIAEYWKKESIKKTIYLVQNAEGNIYVTEMKPDVEKLAPFGWKVIKDRQVDSFKLMWYKVNSNELLEKEVEWPGKYIPIVMVYGKETTIEGHSYYRGVIRNAKDAQRLYNYSRSSSAEMISLAPKAPYLVSARMIANYQKIWENANKKNYPYLPYEADPSAPSLMPRRAEPISANTGIQAEIMMADQELHDTTGLQLASLGKKSNEQSGRAIVARQREGDVANFAYYDNLARALRYAGRVLVDLIPKIYDTPRIVRILNRDGTDKFVPVNQEFEEQGKQQMFDLTVGKYDVQVSIGPSYTTQREESAANIFEFLKVNPAAAPLISDLLVKNMDWPGADEIEKRLKLLLPPQIQQQDNPEEPPPQQPPPPPEQMFASKKLEAEAKQAEIKAEIMFTQLQRLKQGLPMDPPPPQRETKSE